MKKRFCIILVLILLLSGCAPVSEVRETKLNIVTMIYPEYDFARAVAGDRANLTMILKPGAEIHGYEPSVQDILAIQNADIFFYNGGESDVWIEKILNSTKPVNAKIVSMMDTVERKEEEIIEGMDAPEEHGGEHEDKDHADSEEEPEYDEHIWTSPLNAIIMVERICSELCAIDPVNADYYQKNRDSYCTRLRGIDSELRSVTEKAENPWIAVGDRFPFRYLADEYGLHYCAAFPGCTPESDASPSTVIYIIEKIKQYKIPVVFHIEFSNEKMADAICAETGAKKLLLHSCHNVSAEDFKNGVTYADLMEQNAKNLKEALK